ncbi:MAG: GtrA family protein [Cellulomonas sp.]|nr:GtrA family protein [Cellulomonas sp.]
MLTPDLTSGDDEVALPAGGTLRRWLAWRPTRAWLIEMGRFLAVGGMSFIIDLGLFNLLAFGPGHLLGAKPVTAKIIATVVATFASWVGNRHWTFADRRTGQRGREILVYGAINAVAALVPSATLYIALYWMDLNGQLVANAATVVGIAIGTVLRYVGYKLWVFTG